ncbi:hypothetical protein DFH07DRAFT_794147 [Mycena maculata]|uniref:Uncharacterized protein n=1 Tax=Mycena maculata TaxID=230809 RepID=A0AAD7KA65_9AGAR|nr:hypothetical protein DFH07DRAFT_794147 [Mycena maculata]
MQFAFALLSVFVSTVVAAPALRRQNICPLQNFSGLTITASADPSGKTRWDVFTINSELIQEGDVAWFSDDQPNGNEIFTAAVGSQPDLFTFQRQGAQLISVSGSTLLASGPPATFQVACSGGCNSFASGNDLVGDGCTIELTDGTNGLGQCVTFAAANSVVQLETCQPGSPAQQIGIFSVA